MESLVFLQDKTLRENDLVALRKQIEREYQEKVSLEDQIMERLRTQLTLDKASQYSKKLTGRTRERTKHLVSCACLSVFFLRFSGYLVTITVLMDFSY